MYFNQKKGTDGRYIVFVQLFFFFCVTNNNILTFKIVVNTLIIPIFLYVKNYLYLIKTYI